MTMVLATALATFFGRDIYEQCSDAARGMVSSADPLYDLRTAELMKARVRPGFARNDPAQVAVTEVKFETRTGALTTLSARLASSVADNDYPLLLVAVKAQDGKVVRTVELSPAQYEHGAALRDEHIRFSLELRAGEARVAVHAAYPPAAHAGKTPLAHAGAASALT